MIYKFCFLTFVIALASCNTSQNKQPSAESVTKKAIEVSGKDTFKNSKVSFFFRGKKYTSKGQCGNFVFSRISKKNDTVLMDKFEPGISLKRYINDSLIQVSDSLANKISESINSVHYFVQLPYRLNDKAVNKTYLGLDTLKNKVYHKLAVSFEQEGGGSDYQDNYLYWFGKDDYKLDYLAYSFVVNGGGIRFREAYNERNIEGIRFVDYRNYKPKSENVKLRTISDAFKKQQLKLLSKIENQNIQVEKYEEKC